MVIPELVFLGALFIGCCAAMMLLAEPETMEDESRRRG